MLAQGRSSVTLEDILNKVSEGDILAHYLNVYKVPSVIKSPLRPDNNPSFGIYSSDGKKISYTDFSTKERGGLFDLLKQLWNCSFQDVLIRIEKDMINKSNIEISTYKPCSVCKSSMNNSSTDLQCKTREWKKYDIDYWASYGISKEWLKYADVYPISHKIVIKGDKRFTFVADKYAYAYVEHKDNKVTLKIYQPFNKEGRKWSNKHDSSVISLWTKIPEKGHVVCICSSLKDALCLWANTGIPSIAIQGEGYSMSETAINELKRRFTYICIMLDNDKAGLEDGKKLSEETGFINLILPNFEGGKDISDLYKAVGKKEFNQIIIPIFKPYIHNLIQHCYDD